MPRIGLRLLPLLCVFSLLTPAHAQSAPSTGPAWSTAPALLSKLGPEVTLDGFAFRPPQGFLYKKMGTSPQGITFWIFEGPDHSPGLATDLYVTSVLPQGTTLWSADGGMTGALASLRHDLTNIKTTPVEQGMVGIFPALRCYVKGDLKLTPPLQARLGRASLEKHLFVYALGSGKAGYLFVAEDIAPYNSETLPLLEASVLTMHATQ